MPTDFDGDSTLAFMTELTKRVVDFKKEMVGVGDQAGTAIHKTTDETERFGKSVERQTKYVEGMKLELGSVVGLLRGSTGLAAVLYGAGQAVANFAKGELQLRNFATDTGLAAAAIQKMRVQLTTYGLDAKTADQQIAALTAKLDNIKTLDTASPVYKAIAANNPALAKQLLDAERLNQRAESIRIATDKIRTEGPRSRLYLGEQLGVNQSTVAALGRDTSHLVMPWIYDDAALQKFNDEWHNVTQTMENLWGASMMWMASEGNKFFNEARKEMRELQDGIEKLKKDLDLEGLQKGERPKSIPELLFGSGKGKSSSFGERFGEWGDEDEGALPKNARPRSFSTESVERDELEVQKDSNQLLQEIRDLIGGDKQGIWGGGSGAGGRGGAPGAGSPAATSGSTPGTPNRGSTGADGRVPETSGDPAYGGGGGLSREQYDKKFKGTPLEGQYDRVVAAAAKHNVPPEVVAGIMAHESAGGTSRMLRERNNPAGLMDPKTGWKTGQTFGSIEEGIEAAARVIAKNYERGGRSIGGMANIYAPPGAANDPHGLNRGWRAGVEQYVKRFSEGSDVKTKAQAQANFSERFGEWDQEWDQEGAKRAARGILDKSLVASRDLGGAKIRIDFTDTPEKIKGDPGILDQGPFKKLKISRAPQAPSTGGGVDDFNRFAFE